MLKDTVGIVGTGSFGLALANILAENREVLLYARRRAVREELQHSHTHKNIRIRPEVRVTQDLAELPSSCTLIFLAIPAGYFGEAIRSMSPLLKPWHILIHATKGVEIEPGIIPAPGELHKVKSLTKDQVWTMSQLILRETSVVRVGCLAGPNLATEINKGFPAASVVASKFDEVILEGSEALRSTRFRVHGSHDLLGIELAGVLKNVIALASGMIEGLNWGHNTRALLLTHGLAEMVSIGKIFGVDPRSFLGLAGIGDLVATASSLDSRNYRVGKLLAEGNSLEHVVSLMDETAEGIRTVPLVKALAQSYQVSVPITQTLYKVMFEGKNIQDAIQLLMELPLSEDVAFI